MSFTLRPEGRGPLRIWHSPEPERSYVLGADTGGGKSSNDFCAATVIDANNGGQCAVFHARVDALDFAEVVYALSKFYGGRDTFAFTVLETNAHGLAVLEKVRNLGHSSLYTRQAWDAIEQTFKAQIGWVTSMKTRPMLINRARAALADTSYEINDIELVKEMSTFVFTDTGKEEHMEGCHDDLLFSWMLALEGRFTVLDRGVIVQQPEGQKPNPDQWVWDRAKADLEGARRMVYTGEDDQWGDNA